MAGEKKTSGKRFEEMICPVCSKEFSVPDPGMWAFKIWNSRTSRYKCVCRWSCQRRYEKELEEEKQKKKETRKKNRSNKAT